MTWLAAAALNGSTDDGAQEVPVTDKYIYIYSQVYCYRFCYRVSNMRAVKIRIRDH